MASSLMTLKEHDMPTVQTNAVKTYYERKGSGPPIVFVHGPFLDHSQWAPQVDALGDEHTTVTYDLRGHGRTGSSDSAAVSLDQLAADLDALVTELGLDAPLLCGHSLGGCVAQLYAASYPGQLSGLVLANTVTPSLYDRREWFVRSLLVEAAIPPVKLFGYDRAYAFLAWLADLDVGGWRVHKAVEHLGWTDSSTTTTEFVRVARTLANVHETSLDPSSITAPTLVLIGEKEPRFVRRHGPKLTAEIPTATIREIPAAGHVSNLDEPDRFASAVSKLHASIVADTTDDAPLPRVANR
jgi:pimeloyl-ACP methyl ester carboxylesterase